MKSLQAICSVMELEGRQLNGLMHSCATDNSELLLMLLNQTGLLLYFIWCPSEHRSWALVVLMLSLFEKLLDIEQVTFDDIPIPQESDTVHLGVDRNLKGNGNTEKKAQTGWRTMHALMGAGAYGNSGLNPLGVIQDVENFCTTKDVVWTRDV